MLFAVQMSRRRFRYPLGGITTPAEPAGEEAIQKVGGRRQNEDPEPPPDTGEENKGERQRQPNHRDDIGRREAPAGLLGQSPGSTFDLLAHA